MTDVPWGTFAVNAAGSYAFGVLAAAAPSWLLTLGGVGLCGALTTFSTFSFESVRLLEQGRTGRAVPNVLGSVSGALVAVVAGHALGALG